jgi:hypothetical protein
VLALGEFNDGASVGPSVVEDEDGPDEGGSRDDSDQDQVPRAHDWSPASASVPKSILVTFIQAHQRLQVGQW